MDAGKTFEIIHQFLVIYLLSLRNHFGITLTSQHYYIQSSNVKRATTADYNCHPICDRPLLVCLRPPLSITILADRQNPSFTLLLIAIRIHT